MHVVNVVFLFWPVHCCNFIKILQLDDVEEEDGDAIERVLWHRLKRTSMEEMDEDKQPDADHFSDLSWEDQEFYIKWKGQSYLHCQWQTLSELSQVLKS